MLRMSPQYAEKALTVEASTHHSGDLHTCLRHLRAAHPFRSVRRSSSWQRDTRSLLIVMGPWGRAVNSRAELPQIITNGGRAFYGAGIATLQACSVIKAATRWTTGFRILPECPVLPSFLLVWLHKQHAVPGIGHPSCVRLTPMYLSILHPAKCLGIFTLPI